MLSLENAATARASGSTGRFMCSRMPHDARDVNAGELPRQRIQVDPPQKLPNSPLASGRFLLYSPSALTRVLKNRA